MNINLIEKLNRCLSNIARYRNAIPDYHIRIKSRGYNLAVTRADELTKQLRKELKEHGEDNYKTYFQI